MKDELGRNGGGGGERARIGPALESYMVYSYIYRHHTDDTRHTRHEQEDEVPG
jgi:hypothetical protein